MGISTIDSPDRVNRYVDRSNRSTMGNMGDPVFFEGPGTIVPETGNYISAIQADGLTNVVFSAATKCNGLAYTMTGGNKNILAGSSWVLPAVSITIVSGEGVFYQEPLQRDKL